MKDIILNLFLILILFTACRGYTEPEIYEKGQSLIDDYNGRTEMLGKASSMFSEILNENPNSLYGLTGMGRACYKFGYYSGDNYNPELLEKAQIYFSKAIKLDSTFFDAYYYSCYASFFQKDLVNAKKMINYAKNLKPESPKVYLLLTELAYRGKKYDEAIETAMLVSKHTEDKNIKISAYQILTSIYEMRNDNKQTEFYHKKIIELDKNSPWVYHNYAIFLLNTERYDEAIENEKKALGMMNFGAARKVLGETYYYKGLQYYKKNDYLSSRKFFESSLEYYPDYSYSLFCLGMTYYYTGYNNRNIKELKKAKVYLDKTIKVDGNLEEAKEQLSNLNMLLEHLHVN